MENTTINILLADIHNKRKQNKKYSIKKAIEELSLDLTLEYSFLHNRYYYLRRYNKFPSATTKINNKIEEVKLLENPNVNNTSSQQEFKKSWFKRFINFLFK